MPKEGKSSIHLDFVAKQIKDGKEVKGLFIVTPGRVDVSFPDPIVGQITRDYARAFGETLLRALKET